MKRKINDASEVDEEPPRKKHKLTSINILDAPVEKTRIPAGEIIYENDDFQFEYLWNDEDPPRLETLCALKVKPNAFVKNIISFVFDLLCFFK